MGENDNRQQPDNQSQVAFLRAMKDEEVRVVFMDGNSLQGVLTNFDSYTLFIQQGDSPEIAVFKHALKYMYPVKGE